MLTTAKATSLLSALPGPPTHPATLPAPTPPPLAFMLAICAILPCCTT